MSELSQDDMAQIIGKAILSGKRVEKIGSVIIIVDAEGEAVGYERIRADEACKYRKVI